MTGKILTLHPQGKQGVNISLAKYNLIKAAILMALQEQPLTFADLISRLKAQLAGNFDGSVAWYVTTVKLDLEARGEIERLSNTTPQRLRRVSS